MENTRQPKSKQEVSMLEALTLLNKGYSIADLAGVTPDQMDVLYALAYKYYNAESYTEARNIFKALCLYDSTEQKYFMGLAASEQGLHNYDKAAQFYSVCCVLSGLKDPKPMYYAALCLLRAGKKDDAMAALESMSIMGRAGDKAAEDDKFKEKGSKLLETLRADAPDNK